MLSKPVRRNRAAMKDVDAASSDTDESDCETDADLQYDPKQGLTAISQVLLAKIYTSFFSSERYDDQLKKDLLPKAVEQMTQITKLLSDYEKEKLIIPIILDSIKDEDDEERRWCGVVLIEELAEALGQQICQNHLMYDLVSLQDDPVFKIRREVVLRLVKVSKILGEQIFTGVILPVFRKLSTD